MPQESHLHLFESDTMRGLFEAVQQWEIRRGPRLLSINVLQDGDTFCCIALTGPLDVAVVGGDPAQGGVAVNEKGGMRVWIPDGEAYAY